MQRWEQLAWAQPDFLPSKFGELSTFTLNNNMETNVVFLSLQLLLPIFNEFAEKAELNVPLPLTEERVTKSRIGRSYNSGTLLVFDNRYQFNWNCTITNYWGRINSYTDKAVLASLTYEGAPDKEKLMALTKQKSLIDKNEALQIATRVLNRLGYSEKKQKLKPPSIAQHYYGVDEHGNARDLPFFQATWYPKHPPDGVESHAFRIDVSGLTKKVTGFSALWDDTYMDLRPLIKKLPRPLPIATNRTGVLAPSSNPHLKR